MVPGIQLNSPRVVTSPLRARGKALRLTFLGNWRDATDEDVLLNAASFDYGGFGYLESGAVDVLSEALTKLPHMELRGTGLVEAAAKAEGAKFLGFSHARFTTSGYTMNLVAFPALANEISARGKKTVFLMDGSNHNSMFVGAWISKNATIVRFEHNNVHALEAHLITYSAEKDSEIVVAIEGNYSMEGGLPPLPAIIALKTKYSFQIYIDEAHSFLSIGNTGKGIVEHYQDLGFAISSKDIDCIGATLSKSAGTIGGIVVTHNVRSDEFVEQRIQELHNTGGQGLLPTVVKVRLMQIWGKSNMVSTRMESLRQHTVYILDSLHKAGLCVHSDYLSPVIVVIAVSMKLAGKFGAECHRLGLAVTFAGPPATDIWRSVGRLCINALLDSHDVETLVRIVVQAAVNVGIIGDSANALIRESKYTMKEPKIAEAQMESQSVAVDRQIVDLLNRQVTANIINGVINSIPMKLLQHGEKSLRTVGLGSSSVRQYWGTQVAHVSCEYRMANLFPSLKNALVNTGAIMMTDARNAVFSTLAACISPPANKKVTNLVLLPQGDNATLTEALMSMKKHKRVHIARYESLEAIAGLVQNVVTQKQVYLTFFTTSSDKNAQPIDLTSTMASLRGIKLQGLQVLLDDSLTFGKLGNRKLGYLDHLATQYDDQHLKKILKSVRCPYRFFVMGSFHSAFGLQGGYVIGERDIMKVLHWTSRAFLFSTAPLPCNTAMAERAVETLESGQGLDFSPQINKAVVTDVEPDMVDVVEGLAVRRSEVCVY